MAKKKIIDYEIDSKGGEITIRPIKKTEKEKIIEEVKKNTDLNRYPFDEFWFTIGWNKCEKEISDLIEEDMDIELMFTEIKDKKGNKIPESDELMELFSFFWEYVQNRLKQQIKELEK